MNSLKLFFFIFLLSCPCPGFGNGDFQFWNTESISWNASDEFRLTLEEEFRFGDDEPNFFYQHSDLGVVYTGAADWLDIGINYRHIFEKKTDDWREESRPHLNATVKWRACDLSFSNRGCLEYRSRDSAEDFWRYRNKLTVGLPWEFTKYAVRPYVADEIFYDFDANDLIQNRIYAGLYLTLLKNLTGEVFYFWQLNKQSSRWDEVHTLGTKLKFCF